MLWWKSIHHFSHPPPSFSSWTIIPSFAWLTLLNFDIWFAHAVEKKIKLEQPTRWDLFAYTVLASLPLICLNNTASSINKPNQFMLVNGLSLLQTEFLEAERNVRSLPDFIYLHISPALSALLSLNHRWF